MDDKTLVRFRVRDRGGLSANTTLESEAPAFDWDTFKKLFNTEEFVRRAYFSNVKKLIREIAENNKGGTQAHHLSSMESILARSLKFTKKEVGEWIDSRDWSQQTFKIPHDEAIQILKKALAKLTSPNTPSFNDKECEKLQLIISSVADVPSDAVADYLFSRLDEAEPLMVAL